MILRSRLRYEWWLICILSTLAAFGCFRVLHVVWQPAYAWQWFGQTMVLLLYVLGVLRSCLPLNHRKDEAALLPTFGAGTFMTIFRGILLGFLAGFVFLPWPKISEGDDWLGWLPGVLYLLAGCADYLDGYLARITNYETRLGEVFDTKMDALGLLVAPVLAISFGQLPIYYFAVSLAYYALMGGRWLRKYSGKPVFDVPPWPGARLLAGFQMGLVGIVLLPIFSPPATTIAAVVFMIPFLAGFGRDWLISTGKIRPDAEQWKRRERRLKHVLTEYLPLLLRVVACCAGLLLIRNRPAEASLTVSSFWQGITMITFLMLVSGVMGRIAAFVLSLSTGWGIPYHSSSGMLIVLFICSLIILLSGSGMFSLWQPEERVLSQRAGEGRNVRRSSSFGAGRS